MFLVTTEFLHLAAHEKLFPTKARCHFTQLMNNNRDKCWFLVEVYVKFLLNGFPCTENYELHPVDESVPEHVAYGGFLLSD
jgi:hypothetical protein